MFGFDVNTNGQKQTISIETERPLIDGEWHSINIDINEPDMLFQVDNGNAVLTVPVGEEIGPFRGELKIGGTDQ